MDAVPAPRPSAARPEPREGGDGLRAAKLAHELKNPLAGMKALVQLGLRNPAEAASHERLALVEREITRMQEILTRYLSPVGVRATRCSPFTGSP